MELIYCADGGEKFARIAIRHGFTYGAKLPATVYFPPVFVDNEYQNPQRERYMQALKEYRPALATVLDWQKHVSADEVFSWAEEAAQHVSEAVIIIPKVFNTIHRIPETIAGKAVHLGYSVPTSYGGTGVPFEEFGKRPVHLLGGSPHKQRQLSALLNVVSADTNYHQKEAINHNQFFAAGRVKKGSNKRFPKLNEIYNHVEDDAPYLAFELSCMNIQAAWIGCSAAIRFAHEADLPAIKRVANEYKNELGFVMLPALRENIKRKSLLVAEKDGEVVGLVNYRACRDGWQTIYEIAVTRYHRGQCIGAGLLAAIPKPIRLKCTADNPANAFYEAQGFACVGSEDGRKRRLNVWQKAKS